METEAGSAKTPSDDTTATTDIAEDASEPLVHIDVEPGEERGKEELGSNPTTPDNEEIPIVMKKTACGDYHNLGLDTIGQSYSLPSPLNVTSFPGSPALKVTDIACGKEHCMLLTETGQVFSWGGGTRGQLGHGTLASEEKPRLILALDGMKIKKVILCFIELFI